MSEIDEPLISAVVFRDIPQSGSLTSFSYGLSLQSHPDWTKSRPELVLSVDSLQPAWGLVPGELVRRGRGRVSFSYGNILNFGEPVSDDSAMSSFVVYACASIDQSDLFIELPQANVHIVQIYPIYESEAGLVEQIGPEKFLTNLGNSVYDVHRDSLTA